MKKAGAFKRVRGDVAPITARELDDPHVRYFYAQNPGFGQGDVLITLTPLNLENWRAMLRTTLKRQLRQRRRGVGAAA